MSRWLACIVGSLALVAHAGCGDESTGSGGAGGSAGTGTGTTPAGGAGGTGTGTGTGNGGSGAGDCESAPYAPTADWYVGPSGTAGAAGTQADPLDLATAIGSSSPVAAGERVMLLAGTYEGQFTSIVAGAQGVPIVFFAEPGARVTIDSNAAGSGTEALAIEGDWVQFHGLEVMSSDGGRSSAESGSSPTDLTLAGGVTLTASNAKLVNCFVHDNAQGVSFWSDAVDSELYGNVIYHNGWNAPDRGHGHAIYTQNALSTKRIARNVLFFGFSFGVHAYTEGGSIQGFDIVENVWFRTGASVPGEGDYTDGCLVGGLQPVARALLQGNSSWAPAINARGLQLGYGSTVENEDVTLTDNYLVGRIGANGSWQQGTITGNTVHGELVGINPTDYPNNTWSSELPTGQRVVLRVNDYDPSRAELIAYDWSASGAVSVDLSNVVPLGGSYEIRSVLDPWGTPVASGSYQGGEVSVPLGTVTAPDPLGLSGAISGADDPGASFGVFLVRHDVCVEP